MNLIKFCYEDRGEAIINERKIAKLIRDFRKMVLRKVGENINADFKNN